MSHASALPRHATEPASLVFDLAGVAGALGVSPGRFRNIRRELEARGFPKALPVLTGRWSRSAVITWIEHNGQASHAPKPLASDSAIDQAVEELERRYTRGAA